jgi:hypothetical protein
MSGRVVNLSRDDLGDAVYVGRASPRRGLAESAFGNPFVEGRHGTRAEVIEKYLSWLLDRHDLLQRLHELRGRRLACWCKPLPCHGDVLADLVDADEVLDDLAAVGVAVEAVDGRLRLSPASAVSEALRSRVAAHKPALLALLSTIGRQRAIPPADSTPAGAGEGRDETPEEARTRQEAAIERLRLDREAFVEKARRDGVYRGVAAGTGAGVP